VRGINTNQYLSNFFSATTDLQSTRIEEYTNSDGKVNLQKVKKPTNPSADYFRLQNGTKGGLTKITIWIIFCLGVL
jgi:hypothetical protein